ncbi:MAG: SRPBCC domain-containing protein [Anaerolineales bacterium]|nr:SRPBCC domain-containing protein [Anaerolineales bacterium]
MVNQSLSFSKSIQTPIREVYRAFTNATYLREWLCDIATVAPRENGRLYLAWNSGYYVSGEYISLDPDKKVLFNWLGKNEPFATQVSVSLTAKGEKTLIELLHSGLGSGTDWEKISKEIKHGWESGLENLVSVLETGEDLRITQRPMLGIMVGEFNEEVAKEIGVPSSKGIRIDGVLDEMGAKAAGLDKDDVMVEVAGMNVEDWASLAGALEKFKAGDQVEVAFYRGGVKKSTSMTLSKRPLPEIPATQYELADLVSKENANIQDKLDRLLANLGESEASYKPDPKEWNIKENIAHLIQGERYTQMWIEQLLGNQEHFSDDWEGNQHPAVAATAAAYPSLADIREEYRRSMAETVALLNHLPDQFVAKKGRFWRISTNLLEGTSHFDSHFEQMSKLIEESRQKESLG